ncbi:MAG TPA: N-acetyltransferase [Gammaproteobacteria bacterium]|nr:N-acetyltransferase [Gammaproteobacteria bacterium]
MRFALLQSIDQVTPAQWNALAGKDDPFLRFEFLNALEKTACVGKHWGWLPRHLAAFDEDGRLVGAAPMYEKHNSYGEFVFDGAWADAWERAGGCWHPKAVVAIPYTPAPGRRLLVRPGADGQDIASGLIERARSFSAQTGYSSLHWLFPTPADAGRLRQAGFLMRLGCQFHWRNAGYRDFEDFLAGFTARKRKKVRRERRQVAEQGIELHTLHGHEASEEDIRLMHDFYRITFDRKWGYATLTKDFFRAIARDMGEQLVCFLARRRGRPLAGAICFRSDDTLYGRHWGCYEEIPGLHFETCYYQGIEYCIRHGLRHFQPGAQGEHKISRGFLPTQTWSAHWIGDPGFRALVARFLEQETPAMREYIAELATRSPFRAEAA